VIVRTDGVGGGRSGYYGYAAPYGYYEHDGRDGGRSRREAKSAAARSKRAAGTGSRP
jgi:hypothetical protein